MKRVRFGKLIGKIGAMGLLLAINGCTGYQGMPQQESIISVANDPKGIEKWMLEDTHGIASPTHVVLALVSKHREVDKAPLAYSAVASYPRTAKNILFIDKQSNKSSWLFSKNSQLIEEYFSFPRTDYSPFMMNNKKSESKVIFYKVIDRDTNGDGKITAQDSQSLALSNTEGKYYKVIVKDISRVITIKEVGEDMLTIVYQKAGVGYSLSLHFKGFTVLSNEMLPKVGQ